MANKIYNIADTPEMYDILSSTPKNYSKQNYFIKELQDKVNADWKFRPNRVDVEFELTWGKGNYQPIEVVMQSVKSDKGQDLSNDCRRIVFKDIQESRFRLGSKFRFSEKYLLEDFDEEKNVWLVTNFDRASMTSSVIIERCNGSIGSLVVDEQGISKYHYEPVIQGKDLYSTTFRYADPIVAPQSQLTIICQHNEYTKKYFVNQRFIIGYDKVYRITAINKHYSNTTFKPGNIDLIKIYLELTEKSFYDNFETRIAYQMTPEVHLSTQGGNLGNWQYSIGFKEPDFIPTDLTSDEIHFYPMVVIQDGTEIPDIPIKVEISLQNLPSNVNIEKYINFEYDPTDSSFVLSRIKPYLGGNLFVRCSVNEEDSPTGEPFETSFSLVVRKPQEE